MNTTNEGGGSRRTDSQPYHEHIIGAKDCCSNCLRLIRVERVDPARSGIGREYESRLERNRQTTTIGYGPADSMSERKGVFCTCGVESARERIWADADVDTDRFREFVQRMLRTLDAKGVTVNQKRTAGHALQARRDGAGVDDALATGLDHGLAAATTRAAARPAD